MNLLEHEAKALLGGSGFQVPDGKVVSDLKSLKFVLEQISYPSMIKGQVPAGGRGKAGAIRKVMSDDESIIAFEEIMRTVVKGQPVTSVLVESFYPHGPEYFLAIAVDRTSGRPVLMAARKGGMDVEGAKDSDLMKIDIDPLKGVDGPIISNTRGFLALGEFQDEELAKMVSALWDFFVRYDCELVEINPLIVSDDRGLVCLDAKVVINDDSMFRHKDLGLDTDRGKTAFERRCRERGFSGVELDGDVAVLANGAGLTMAVLDGLDDIGLDGGAFLDLGGSDDPSKIADAVMTVLDRGLLPRTRGVLICVFGGITRCDVVAKGFLDAISKVQVDVPIVIRLKGSYDFEGLELLRSSGIPATSDLDESIRLLRGLLEEDA